MVKPHLALAFGVLFAAGCKAPRTDDEDEPRGGKTNSTSKAAPEKRPGRVEGLVRFEGELPPLLPVNLTGPHAAECESAKGVYELSVVRGPDGGLANAFVAIEKAPPPRGSTKRTRTIAIDGCVIKPYVIDATEGDTLEVQNEDARLYLCGLGRSPRFTQGVLAGASATFPLEGPGGRRINCTQDYPWLWGHVLVARHPYHAVTTANGRFTIENIPPGTYPVKAWHPTQGQTDAQVTVPENGVGRVEVVFRARPRPAQVGAGEADDHVAPAKAPGRR